MTTNKVLTEGIYSSLEDFADDNSLEIIFGGMGQEFPKTGKWMEVLLSDTTTAPYLSDNATIKSGTILVNFCDRVGNGELDLKELADTLTSAYPLLTSMGGSYVTKPVIVRDTVYMHDRVIVPCYFEYYEE